MRVIASVAPKPSATDSTAVPNPTSNDRITALCQTDEPRKVPNQRRLKSFDGQHRHDQHDEDRYREETKRTEYTHAAGALGHAVPLYQRRADPPGPDQQRELETLRTRRTYALSHFPRQRRQADYAVVQEENRNRTNQQNSRECAGEMHVEQFEHR
jgi:hypothetical protein